MYPSGFPSPDSFSELSLDDTLVTDLQAVFSGSAESKRFRNDTDSENQNSTRNKSRSQNADGNITRSKKAKGVSRFSPQDPGGNLGTEGLDNAAWARNFPALSRLRQAEERDDDEQNWKINTGKKPRNSPARSIYPSTRFPPEDTTKDDAAATKNVNKNSNTSSKTQSNNNTNTSINTNTNSSIPAPGDSSADVVGKADFSLSKALKNILESNDFGGGVLRPKAGREKDAEHDDNENSGNDQNPTLNPNNFFEEVKQLAAAVIDPELSTEDEAERHREKTRIRTIHEREVELNMKFDPRYRDMNVLPSNYPDNINNRNKPLTTEEFFRKRDVSEGYSRTSGDEFLQKWDEAGRNDNRNRKPEEVTVQKNVAEQNYNIPRPQIIDPPAPKIKSPIDKSSKDWRGESYEDVYKDAYKDAYDNLKMTYQADANRLQTDVGIVLRSQRQLQIEKERSWRREKEDLEKLHKLEVENLLAAADKRVS
jgi:hypothetical protein